MEHLSVFLTAALVSGLAGLAALLRSGALLTVVGTFTALLNSSLLGLGLSLVWFNQFQASPHILVGICILLGLGGMPTLDFILKMFLRGGLAITMGGGSLRVDTPETAPAKSKEL